MIRDALLAIGLLLSTASQLRLGGFPLGPGEVCLVVWFGSAFIHDIYRVGPALTQALPQLLVFWVTFALAQSIGATTGLLIEMIRDTSSALHDLMAYTLLAGVSCLAAAELGAERRLRRVTWFVAVLGAISLGAQLGEAFRIFNLPKIDVWYWDRMQGWAENPNQLGLLAAFLTAISFHLLDTAGDMVESLAALACACVALLVGSLTRSDSFIVFLMIAGPLFIALKFWTWISPLGPQLTFRAQFAWVILISLPLQLIPLAVFSPVLLEKAEKYSDRMFADNDQGETRINLWKEAISIGLEAKMLGLGPGPHLRSKSYKRPPPDRFEAHNTILDLFTQAGLLGVMSFLWLVGTVILTGCRSRLPALAALGCGLVIFSMFHLVVRHPIFWFGIVLCLVEGARAQGALIHVRGRKFDVVSPPVPAGS
jgi:O-antigen ligase